MGRIGLAGPAVYPVPCVKLTSACDGSGRAGGRCRGEWIDRWFADEEAQYLADFVSFQLQPVPAAVQLFVLLLNERLLAAGLLSHHGDDDAVAAEVVHDLEQSVPEGAGAEAGHDGEICADLADGAADRAAAHLTLEILQCGHEEFGIVRA